MQSGSLPYGEQTTSTKNTKLAAVFMLFGFALKRHNPFEWHNEFSSKELYIKSLKDPSIKPERVIHWNFETAGPRSSEINRAFYSKDSDKLFDLKVDELVSDLEARKQLRAAHSAAVAQGAREALDHREHLVKLLKTIPPLAKWIVVYNARRDKAIFGPNASIETRTELLNKI